MNISEQGRSFEELRALLGGFVCRTVRRDLVFNEIDVPCACSMNCASGLCGAKVTFDYTLALVVVLTLKGDQHTFARA